MQIKSAALDDEGDELHLVIDVCNPAPQPVYACASVRAIHYDPSSRALAIDLAAPAAGGAALTTANLLPRIVTLAAQQRTRLDATLPRTVARVASGSAQAAGPAGPAAIESLAIHQATSVTVAVAWSERAPPSADAWPANVASFQFTRAA